ncbi:PTI1-like tyrosine-protein kinase At3g15890 [Trifolium pratense]|uniref:PTI1-like tyrosine-protein kinase At3g15890 n=1 Tax=Trifolium pratense TaxID=57577 RepID=UPI001E692E9E|nr:PTI1-like tyrosine-protein kinase At3g15890 [Trifolium pratense]
MQISVKRLKVWSNKADGEFAVELEILGRVQHKNLIGLRGYCAEGQEQLIVYDYMPNFNLFAHLHGPQSAECLLDWSRRMNIAIGCAEGVVYLHHQATPRIIHRDIKPSSVLLDSNFEALIGGFGFAKLIPDSKSQVTTNVKGTLGYLAPEYAMFGKASESCDVYSFSILLLELASGRKPIVKVSSTLKQYSIILLKQELLGREGKHNELNDSHLRGRML